MRLFLAHPLVNEVMLSVNFCSDNLGLFIKSINKSHTHISCNISPKLDIFYLRPLPVAPKNPIKPWFYSSPIGKNVLSSMLKTMCVDAGIEGHKTNHSLRATGATEMFKAGVPEKIIQQRTGHMSLKALGVYES